MTRTPPLALDAFEATAAVAERSPADEASLTVGRRLGIKPLGITKEWAARYVEDVRERDPLYLSEGLSHPGQLPRLFNWALTHNVVLGPWIHVASKTDHFAAARIGDELTVRAKVTANYEKKGHRFVDLDGLVVANATTPDRPHRPHRDLPAARRGVIPSPRLRVPSPRPYGERARVRGRTLLRRLPLPSARPVTRTYAAAADSTIRIGC